MLVAFFLAFFLAADKRGSFGKLSDRPVSVD
jgi:hypothetical protein